MIREIKANERSDFGQARKAQEVMLRKAARELRQQAWERMLAFKGQMRQLEEMQEQEQVNPASVQLRLQQLIKSGRQHRSASLKVPAHQRPRRGANRRKEKLLFRAYGF